MHFLLLTPDLQKGQFVAQGLRYENLSVDILHFSNLELKSSQYHFYDGVFIFLPDESMLDQISHYLPPSPAIPCVLLTSRFSSALKDFSEKKIIKTFFIRPFPFRLIASEMRAFVFREREKIEESVLKIRDLELHREAREIIVNGEKIYLRNKEFALLEFFMMNAGKVLSRGTILENVWDRNANIFTNTVDVHINKLRKKVDSMASQRFIHTVPCSGYLFS